MNGPRFRFLVVITFLCTALWLYLLLSQYLLGAHGLNLSRYLNGAFIVGITTLIGYTFVWGGIRFMQHRDQRKTGFEATNIDETGTKFNMQLSLSKFKPEIVAAPSLADASPLEAELVGFLNSLSQLPYDLNNPDYTLREHALRQWEAMKTLQGAGPLHRAAALAQDLSKVYAYQEKRKAAPVSQFWVRDTLSYSRRSNEHGGMAAFILSQMPSFRKLSADPRRNELERRALLTAIRYCKDPLKMPLNCDPLTREIYEYLNKAHVKAREMAGEDIQSTEPTPGDLATLQQDLITQLPHVFADIGFDADDLPQRHGFYLGEGVIGVRVPFFLQKLIPLLSPQTRHAFNLWDMRDVEHHFLPHLIEQLRLKEWLVENWDGEKSTTGTFNFTIGTTNFTNTILIQIMDGPFRDTRERASKATPLNLPVDIQQDPKAYLESIQKKTKTIDAQLSEAFPRY